MTRSLKRHAAAWLELKLMRSSKSIEVDGLWLGAIDEKKANLDILIEAVDLLRKFDPVRYNRIRGDLRRIWLTATPGRVGEYREDAGLCKIDQEYASRTHAAAVALVIVHEATHARLRRFGYAEIDRKRIEKICLGRELAFARMLPGGEALVEWVSQQLKTPTDYSSPNLERLRRSGELKMARDSGIPVWIISLAHRVRNLNVER